jgi:hypothetical protein
MHLRANGTRQAVDACAMPGVLAVPPRAELQSPLGRRCCHCQAIHASGLHTFGGGSPNRTLPKLQGEDQSQSVRLPAAHRMHDPQTDRRRGVVRGLQRLPAAYFILWSESGKTVRMLTEPSCGCSSAAGMVRMTRFKSFQPCLKPKLYPLEKLNRQASAAAVSEPTHTSFCFRLRFIAGSPRLPRCSQTFFSVSQGPEP